MLPRAGRPRPVAEPGASPAVFERVESSLALGAERKSLECVSMPLALRILRWVVGLVLIYPVLLKEDDEKRVQSRAESLWIKLDDGREVALSRATAFLRVLASTTGAIFDRLFGKKLISVRGLCVSLCYSIASCLLLSQLLIAFSPKPHGPTDFRSWLQVGMFLLVGSLPALQKQEFDSSTLRFWEIGTFVAVLFPCAQIILRLYKLNRPASVPHFVEFLVFLFTISVVSDFAYIALTRWMLRKASELEHAFGILGIVMLDCALGISLFLVPISLGFYIGSNVPMESALFVMSAGVMFGGPAMNAIDVLACSLFLVLMVLMLLHRLLWPVLEIPIYTYQRYGLIKNKWWLVAAGASLILGKSFWAVFLEILNKLGSG